MPPAKDLLKYLDNSKIKYEILEHKTVYTAMDKAGTLHIDPKSVVKTAVLKLNTKDYALALIPANKLLDKNKLKKIANKKVDFATEAWMKKNLTGQVGATPAFGSLWNLPTFVDNSLLRQPKLISNAGDYNVSIKLTKAAFAKAAGQIIKGSFSQIKK